MDAKHAIYLLYIAVPLHCQQQNIQLVEIGCRVPQRYFGSMLAIDIPGQYTQR